MNEEVSKHGEIVDAICDEAGIPERRRKGSVILDKKESLHVLKFIKTTKELKEVSDGAR